METFKFILFSVVVLVLLGLLGYWAVVTLQSGPQFATNQKIQQLQKENSDLTKQVADLTDELNTLAPKPVDATPVVVPVSTPKVVTYKNQDLIDQLQKLIDGNVLMKQKSSGTRVGTVQTFLNLYNNTSNKIDNDYGASMEKAISVFQKDQGLGADGQAGSGTFQKLIDWLKKQG